MKYFQAAQDDALTSGELALLLEQEAKARAIEAKARLKQHVKVKENCLRFIPVEFIRPGQSPGGEYRPTGKPSALDKVAEDLAKVVERKGWCVPGVRVEMGIKDCSSRFFGTITAISGGDPGRRWSVQYHRAEHADSAWNVCSAAGIIDTPRQEIWLYPDGASRCFKYAGCDWASDEKKFCNSAKLYAKEQGEKKTYLEYNAKAGSDVMAFSDDDREYSPEENEPRALSKREVFESAETFLRDVIAGIEKRVPDSALDREELIDELFAVKAIPVPENTPDLHVVAFHEKSDTGALVCVREAFSLLPVAAKDPDRPISKEAYKTFSYGYPAEPLFTKTPEFGEDPLNPKNKIIRVRLTKANDICVVNEEAYAAALDGFPEEQKTSAVNGQMCRAEAQATLARTIIPLSDYDGSFRRPLYLIARPLDASEAVDVTEEVGKRLMSIVKPVRPQWSPQHRHAAPSLR
jgi:hypothetical protein